MPLHIDNPIQAEEHIQFEPNPIRVIPEGIKERPQVQADPKEVEVKARLQTMARQAMNRPTGLMCLDGLTTEHIREAVRPPYFFSRAKAEYRALEGAAKACDEAFEKLTHYKAADFAGQHPLEEAESALIEYVNAQNAFTAAIDQYMAKSGRHPTGLLTLRNAAQNRVGEILNFAAQMRVASPESLQRAQAVGVLGAVARSAVIMHGGQYVLGEVTATAKSLFEQLDQLEHNEAHMSSEDFCNAVDTLEEKAKALKTQLQRARNNSPVEVDEGAFEAVAKLIDRSIERVDALKHVNERSVVLKVIENALPEFTKAEVELIVARGTKSEAPHLRELFRKQNELVAKIKAQVKAKSEIDFPEKMREQQKDFNEADILNNILDEYSSTREQEIDPSFESVWRRLNTFLQAKPKTIEAEGRQIQAMLNGIGRGVIDRSKYISTAFQYNLNLPVVVEASLRGIPAEQLELTASDEVLLEAKPLGNGAVNEVVRCTYRGPNGDTKTYVFKPELNARRGLELMQLRELGYDENVTAMQLNLASAYVADAIGCGDVIAQSRIGSYKDAIGLFMEEAPGVTPNAMGAEDFRWVDTHGNALTVAEGVNYMKKIGTFETLRANLLLATSKLEWADLLSGQSDRHGSNYLVDINLETGAVKLTGIDNDASFGARRMGLNKIFVRDFTQNQYNVWRLTATDINPEDGTIDINQLNADQRERVQRILGLNQMSTPAVIDRRVYDALLALNPEQYKTSLQGYMDEKAVASALSRLSAAQAHARHLGEEGRVIDDWTDGRVTELVADAQVADGESSWVAHLMKGFYNRDLRALFEPKETSNENAPNASPESVNGLA